MKIGFEQIVDFISKEVMKEVEPKYWNDFILRRQLNDYLLELKKRVCETWEGLE